jgi:methyl-accepting chemotaxis protein
MGAGMDSEVDIDLLLAQLGEQSGDISLQCSATGGFLGKLNHQIEAEAERLAELDQSMNSLESNQRESRQAAKELLQTAKVAQEKLASGNRVAAHSLDRVAALVKGVTGLEVELQTVVEHIETLGGISKAMREIAEQTRMLGFNARIEAERGGEATRPFAIVADEIRKLAEITAESSINVGARLSQLERATKGLIGGVETNINRGKETGGDLDSLRGTLSDMAALVLQFQQRSESIASCTERSDLDVTRLADGLVEFQEVAAESATRADEARQQLDALENQANDMLNKVAHGGVYTRNTKFIDLALEGAAEMKDRIERAIAEKELSLPALFDTKYRPIRGTDPVQYENGFCDFADRKLQPALDYRTSQDPAIVGCVLVDMNGYLPTHITARSEKQRAGQRKWNLEFSRNRQIFMDTQTRRALDDDGEFFLYAYRQDLGDGRFRALRSVLVPLHFDGRKWGLYEVGYLI